MDLQPSSLPNPPCARIEDLQLIDPEIASRMSRLKSKVQDGRLSQGEFVHRGYKAIAKIARQRKIELSDSIRDDIIPSLLFELFIRWEWVKYPLCFSQRLTVLSSYLYGPQPPHPPRFVLVPPEQLTHSIGPRKVTRQIWSWFFDALSEARFDGIRKAAKLTVSTAPGTRKSKSDKDRVKAKFAVNLNRIKKELGLTWDALSAACNLNRSTVLRHSKGTVCPDDLTLEEYAKGLTTVAGRDITVAMLIS